MLKPFVWPHPFIFNLPKCFLQIFDSPVPFLAGVSKSLKNILHENELLDSHEYVLYVDLDSNGDNYFKKMTNDVPDDTFNILVKLLQKDWDYMERMKSEVYKSRDEMIYLTIVEKLENFIKINIIDKLPQSPMYLEKSKKVLGKIKILKSFIFPLYRFWISIMFRKSCLKKATTKLLLKV